MYWNFIEGMSKEFTVKYGHAPSIVIMNIDFYNKLEYEMIGKQWLVLIKCSSIRGMKIMIDNNIDFVIVTDSHANFITKK